MPFKPGEAAKERDVAVSKKQRCIDRPFKKKSKKQGKTVMQKHHSDIVCIPCVSPRFAGFMSDLNIEQFPSNCSHMSHEKKVFSVFFFLFFFFFHHF